METPGHIFATLYIAVVIDTLANKNSKFHNDVPKIRRQLDLFFLPKEIDEGIQEIIEKQKDQNFQNVNKGIKDFDDKKEEIKRKLYRCSHLPDDEKQKLLKGFESYIDDFSAILRNEDGLPNEDIRRELDKGIKDFRNDSTINQELYGNLDVLRNYESDVDDTINGEIKEKSLENFFINILSISIDRIIESEPDENKERIKELKKEKRSLKKLLPKRIRCLIPTDFDIESCIFFDKDIANAKWYSPITSRWNALWNKISLTDTKKNYEIIKKRCETDLVDISTIVQARKSEDKEVRQTANKIWEALNIDSLLENDYLLNCYLHNRAIDKSRIAKYIITEGEFKKLYDDLRPTVKKDVINRTIKILRSEMSNSLGRLTPFLIFGGIEPDIDVRGTKFDLHHVEMATKNQKASPQNIKVQLSIILARAIEKARERDIDNAIRAYGILCHLALDALIRKDSDISNVLKKLSRSDRTRFNMIFGIEENDNLSKDETQKKCKSFGDSFHKKEDNMLMELIKEKYEKGDLLESSDTYDPINVGLATARLIDEIEKSFGCFEIGDDKDPHYVTSVDIEGKPTDPILNAITCLAKIGICVLNEVPDLRGTSIKDPETFDNLFVFKEHEKHLKEIEIICNKSSGSSEKCHHYIDYCMADHSRNCFYSLNTLKKTLTDCKIDVDKKVRRIDVTLNSFIPQPQKDYLPSNLKKLKTLLAKSVDNGVIDKENVEECLKNIEKAQNEYLEQAIEHYKRSDGYAPAIISHAGLLKDLCRYKKGSFKEEDLEATIVAMHARAHCNIGFHNDDGKIVSEDNSVAVKLVHKATKYEDAKSQYKLALCYYRGDGVPEYMKEAVKWYTKAALQGNARAQYDLGVCYYRGDGIPKNEEKAVEWFRKAAEQGDAKAQRNLGICYYNGEGVPKNIEEAIKWLTRPAEQGMALAQSYLSYCYCDGYGVPENKEIAVTWLTMAANQGDVVAQCDLGICYDEGDEGIPENKKTAVMWFRKAAKLGYAQAQRFLALSYYNGEGVSKNKKLAVEWFHKAALQGDTIAQYDLALCYYNGDGVPENKKKAAMWFRKAAELGHEEAAEALKQLFE